MCLNSDLVTLTFVLVSERMSIQKVDKASITAQARANVDLSDAALFSILDIYHRPSVAMSVNREFLAAKLIELYCLVHGRQSFAAQPRSMNYEPITITQ